MSPSANGCVCVCQSGASLTFFRRGCASGLPSSAAAFERVAFVLEAPPASAITSGWPLSACVRVKGRELTREPLPSPAYDPGRLEVWPGHYSLQYCNCK